MLEDNATVEVAVANPGSNDDPKFQCERCPKAFSRREHLRRHSLLHSLTRPFACPACPKTFYRKDMLQRHLPSHGIARSETIAAGNRVRTSRACTACRHRKVACTGDEPCARCQKDGVECHREVPTSNDDSHAVAALIQAPSMFGSAQPKQTNDHEPESKDIDGVESPNGGDLPDQKNTSITHGLPLPGPSTTTMPPTNISMPVNGSYQVGTRTPRTLRACEACAKSKMGCDGQDPCARCQQRNIRCTRQLAKAARRALAGETAGHRASSGTNNASSDEQQRASVATINSGDNTTNLSTRDVEILIKAYSCMKQEISINYDRMAQMAQLKDGDSAKATWHTLKKKIEGIGYGNVVVKPVAPRQTTMQRPSHDGPDTEMAMT